MKHQNKHEIDETGKDIEGLLGGGGGGLEGHHVVFVTSTRVFFALLVLTSTFELRPSSWRRAFHTLALVTYARTCTCLEGFSLEGQATTRVIRERERKGILKGGHEVVGLLCFVVFCVVMCAWPAYC